MIGTNSMPRNTYFQHYNLDFDDQKVFSISQFLGVDYTPSLLQADSSHATDMLNVIYKDRCNQKRNSYEQIGKFEPIEFYQRYDDGTLSDANLSPSNINGMWKFVGEDDKEHVIAHIGNLLYEIHNLNDNFFNITSSIIGSYEEYVIENENDELITMTRLVINYKLENAKSNAFIGFKRLYILDGNKFYVLKLVLNNANYEFKLNAVEDDEDTFIPLTTIGITYEDSSVNARQGLDDVNLMTQFRKNKLVSGTYIDDGISVRSTRFWDYTLDTSIKPKNETDINKITITISALKEQTKGDN